MPGSDLFRLRNLRKCTFALWVAAAMTVPAVGSANAQNLLDSLFGGRTASAPAPLSAGVSDPKAWDFIDRPAGQNRPAAKSGTTTGYCVRLCDGSFFPLPRNAGASQMSSAKTCSAICPAAKTRIFSGTAIERAVANDGKQYTSLKTAFLYREKYVDDCNCTRGSGGVATIDVMDDPTLRRGDIVVTRDGPMVFTGTSRTKEREQAFVPAADYAGLPKSVRQKLAGMLIAKDPSETASLPAEAVPAILIVPVSHGYAQASMPVAKAFASFAR